jgi:UDP-N-acetylmuramate-alanine ligase
MICYSKILLRKYVGYYYGPKTFRNYFLERDFQVKKKSGGFRNNYQRYFCFAVAGTHGKTTTSILGHIWRAGRMLPLFGGIVENYNSNLIGSGKTVTVVEADEFDRSLFASQYCVHNLYGCRSFGYLWNQ